jgi:hypothetical protein
MKRRLRDVLAITTIASYRYGGGFRASGWCESESWLFAVWETKEWGRVQWAYQAKRRDPAPNVEGNPEPFTTLHAARVRLCHAAMVVAGAMSADGMQRRTSRLRFMRDKKALTYRVLPWQWEHDP